MLIVRDAMLQVTPIRPSDPVFVALDEMNKQGIGFMPVVQDDGSLYGMVTEGDLIRLLHRSTLGADETVPKWLRGVGKTLLRVQSIKEVLTRTVDTIGPDQTLEEAAEMMLRANRKVLPVVENGQVIGYLTRAAIINLLIN